MRPGRLDRIIYIPPPSPSDRIEILRIKTTSMAVDPQINIEEIAQMTEGCSGAELSAMCRDAALETMAGNMDAPYVRCLSLGVKSAD
jgi:AAA family ATPase